jgi:hypothetical protein
VEGNMSLCSNPRLQIAMLEWRSCEQITCGKLQRVGGLSHMSSSSFNTWKKNPQQLHTSSTKYTYIYIYMYKIWGCLISLFSSAQRKKQTYKQKFLEKKNNGTTNFPPLFH